VEAYLRPEDDGLPMRPSGSWVAEKLDYLRRYVDMFTTSMRSKSAVDPIVKTRKRRFLSNSTSI